MGTAIDDTLSAGGTAAEPGTFAPGTQVGGRYRIVRFVGAGGMGIVYEAEDLVLGGQVALKALHSELAGSSRAVERLRREVALARRVTHPNVCRMHDLGEHEGRVFLTMELLVGETLGARAARGPLSLEELDHVAAELVHGLAALHAAGVIHRDLKPSNVLLVDGGRAVLTDFGLARLTRTSGDASLTRESAVLGTPAYMAPEQVEGRSATPATDIYALGVVLFELATGGLPFHEDTAMATATARLHMDPPRPSDRRAELAGRWDAVILRCLAREPAARFERVEDLLAVGEIRRGRTRRWWFVAAGAGLLAAGAGVWRLRGSAPDLGSVATLALVPVPADGGPLAADPRLFALTQDVHDALAALDAADLIGFDTIRRLAGAVDPVGEAATLSDATVRIALANEADQWVVDVELAVRGQVLSQARRRRVEVEATLLVADVVEIIAAGLQRRAPPTPVDAGSYPVGVYRRYGAALAAVPDLALLERVVAEAPRLSRAAARLARRLVDKYDRRGGDPAFLAPAAAMAAQALAIDPRSALAHAARAATALARWEWPEAIAETARAVALAPRDESVRADQANLLMVIGRFDEAIAIATRLDALDPRATSPGGLLGWCLLMGRRYADAIGPLERAAAAAATPEQQASWLGFVAVAQAELARHKDALATIARILTLSPSDYTLAQIATVYATVGHRDEATAQLHYLEGTHVDRFMLAWVYAAVGETEAALPLLEQVVDEHNNHALLLKVTFLPQPVRAHPRFAALLERVGFPP